MKTEIRVSKLDKDDIVTILSGFNSYSGYWANTDYDSELYKESKKEEMKLQNTDFISWEEVISNMLLHNHSIIISDTEEDFEDVKLNLTNLLKGLNMAINKNKLSTEPEDWDGPDCDSIIQYAIFDEIVFG